MKRIFATGFDILKPIETKRNLETIQNVIFTNGADVEIKISLKHLLIFLSHVVTGTK
jgi:hypothetical protein